MSNYKTELRLSNSSTVLAFDNAAQKAAYVKLLVNKGATCAAIPAEVEAYASGLPEQLEEEVLIQEVTLLPEQLEALRKLGWLREKSPELVKPKTKDISIGKLNPTGRMKSLVTYEGIEFPMPNVYSAIVGNLLAQGILDGDIPGTLSKLPGKPVEFIIEYTKSVLERGVGQADLLGAIELAYLQALELNPGLEEALLSTGDTILVYHTEADPLMGLAKDGRDRVGDNLVGHVLMHLRSELGGSIDPRIQIIRGKKVYTAEDIQPTFDGCEEGYPMELGMIQAKFFLGKAPSTEKKLVKYQEQVKLLGEFMVSRNWWPLPELRDTVFIFGGISTLPKPLKEWINFLNETCGIQFSAAKVHGDLGIGYLQPIEKEFRVNSDVQFDCLPYDPSMAGNWLQLPLCDAAEWWAWYLSEQTDKLAPEDMVELFNILTMCVSVGATTIPSGGKLTMSQGSEVYEWDFRYGSVKARQNRTALKTTLTYGDGVSSKFTMLWLAIQCHKNFKGINNTLNRLTNLWEREANYGHKWEKGHPTQVIRDNSGAPIPWTAGYGTPLGIMPVNGKFNTELFLNLIHTPAYRHDAYIDKNGNKLIAGNGAGAAALTAISYPKVAHLAFHCLDAGVNPLLVLPLVIEAAKMPRILNDVLKGKHAALVIMMEFGRFLTANDGAKITKFLNRAQQGGSWNEVYAFLVNKITGEIIHRTRSLFVVTTQPKEDWVRATEADEEALLNLF